MSETGRLRLTLSLRSAGITDHATLRAIELVPREQFLAESQRHLAYENRTLPLPHGQTLSAPDVVARMTQALSLQSTDRVLEIGTGSGYQAAVLAQLAGRVHTIERWPGLSQMAVNRFAALGLRNIEAAHGDGFHGWPSKAPFDAIIVTCGAETLPPQLLTQLGQGGRMVVPLKSGDAYELHQLTRVDDEIVRRSTLGAVHFVPFLRGVG